MQHCDLYHAYHAGALCSVRAVATADGYELEAIASNGGIYYAEIAGRRVHFPTLAAALNAAARMGIRDTHIERPVLAPGEAPTDWHFSVDPVETRRQHAIAILAQQHYRSVS